MDDSIAAMTGLYWVGPRANIGGRTQPTRKEIAELAYQLWETDGRQDGNDVHDWLAAERQLVNHYA
jgi:hypothetical protein